MLYRPSESEDALPDVIGKCSRLIGQRVEVDRQHFVSFDLMGHPALMQMALAVTDEDVHFTVKRPFKLTVI